MDKRDLSGLLWSPAGINGEIEYWDEGVRRDHVDWREVPYSDSWICERGDQNEDGNSALRFYGHFAGSRMRASEGDVKKRGRRGTTPRLTYHAHGPTARTVDHGFHAEPPPQTDHVTRT